MPPFDRRRSFPGRTAFGRTAPAVFTSDDLDRDLTALMQDPLYWRERDRDFADHVTRQFERVHGPDGPTPDGVGKRRGTLEVPRLRLRPGDERLSQPVGRDAPNRPDDVTRLQRALSETGDYTFTAPRERSGVMSATLETALTRYQRRTGLQPDGYVAPGGPTVQQIAAEAETQMTTVTNKRVDGSGTAVSDRLPQASSKVDNSYGKSGKREDDPSHSTACRNAKVSHQNAQGQVENARDQLRREQRDLENVKRAMEEIRAGQAQTLTDAILEELIKRILFSLGLAGKIAYIIREGIKYIDTKQTMSNLKHYRRTLENATEEWENKLKIHKEEAEKARERMLTHCGRDVLPEEPDKIGRRPGATTAEA